MALQSDAIQSRLEGLRLEDRRSMYDSQIFVRPARRASRRRRPVSSPRSRTACVGPDQPIEQVILMLDELSRRIEGLEKKNRNLGEEIRHRGRDDRRWRSIIVGGGLALAVFLYLGWQLRWF